MMATWNVGYNAAGAALDFTTIASALASGSVSGGDTIFLWYSNGTKSISWYSAAQSISKAVTITSGISNKVATIVSDSSGSSPSTAFSIAVNGASITGVTFKSGFLSILMGGAYSVTVSNCVFMGVASPISAATGTLTLQNCLFVGGFNGVSLSGGTIIAHNCTAYGCQAYGFRRVSGTFTAINCCAVFCGANFSGTFSATSKNNASNDNTYPSATSNIDLRTSNAKFITDVYTSTPIYADCRITEGSDLLSAGYDVGLTSDIDGLAYPVGSFPIGCSSIKYLNDRNYVLATSSPTGLYVPPSAADVRPVSFGVSQTGTLENLNGTESAYQALEAMRNTDPGITNVRNGTAYKIANASLTGTLTSLATTSTPTSLSIVDDGDGCAWRITAGVGATDAVYLYNNANDFLIGVFDADSTTEDLTPGVVCYCKALAADKALSARYPASGGVTVPSLAPVSTVDPATVVVTDNRDGETATADFTDSPSVAAINEIYLARYSAHGPLTWVLAGSRTGDGELEVSPGPGQWVAQVRTTVGAATGIGLGSTFWVTSADDQRRQRVRDRTASASLRVARRLGFQIAYQSPGLQQLNLWAIPETFSRSTSMLGGETGTTSGRITVPRQADFPPYDGIVPGAKVWIDGIPYAADISWSAESADMAPTFTMELTRLDVSVELDDEDNIA